MRRLYVRDTSAVCVLCAFYRLSTCLLHVCCMSAVYLLHVCCVTAAWSLWSVIALLQTCSHACRGIDHSVAGIQHTTGGSTAAYTRWERFKLAGLSQYAAKRNNSMLRNAVSRQSGVRAVLLRSYWPDSSGFWSQTVLTRMW